jgi:ATP-dependent protease ClpP protease subunit
MEFEYVIDPLAEEPIMVIDSHIGPDEITESGVIIKGIDGAKWARELLMLDSMGKRRVQVRINSTGGLVSDGYSICSAMLHTKCKVDTFNGGLAASIAAVAFMCGRDRQMADYSILMFHDPHGGDDQEALLKMRNSLATLIAARCGLKLETILSIMNRTTWMDASEAIEIPGFITDIEISSDTNKGRLAPIRNDAKEFWKTSQSIFNKTIEFKSKTKKNMSNDFKSINNRLGLMDEANESSRLKALDAIENSAKEAINKASTAEKSLKEMEDKMAKMKSEMEDEAKKQKEAYDKINSDYIKMKADVEEKEKVAAEKEKEKVKNEAAGFVKSLVDAGKIKNDATVIEKITNKYIADSEGVKDMFEMIGVNAKGPDFSGFKDFAGKGAEGKKTPEEIAAYENKLIADRMAENAKKNKK